MFSQNQVEKLINSLENLTHNLPQDILINLITTKKIIFHHHSDCLTKLKPEQCIAIYEHCSESLRDKNGCLSIDLIKLFPAAIREKGLSRTDGDKQKLLLKAN